MGVVLTALFLAILQLGLFMHVRNTLVACAADGARYGANANRTPADGAEHARQRIRAALADSLAGDVRGVSEDGVVRVRVTARIPLVGLWGPRQLRVQGSAFDERALIDGRAR